MPYPQSYALHALDASDEFLDGIIELDIFVAFFADLVVSMDDRRMVTAAETAANLGQGSIGELTAQIHGDLPRESQIARALLGVISFVLVEGNTFFRASATRSVEIVCLVREA